MRRKTSASWWGEGEASRGREMGGRWRKVMEGKEDTTERSYGVVEPTLKELWLEEVADKRHLQHGTSVILSIVPVLAGVTRNAVGGGVAGVERMLKTTIFGHMGL
ncbi:hypothetical protein AAC387_Pa10g0145 [Persea americana]